MNQFLPCVNVCLQLVTKVLDHLFGLDHLRSRPTPPSHIRRMLRLSWWAVGLGVLSAAWQATSGSEPTAVGGHQPESLPCAVQGSRTPSRLPAAIEDWLLASQISFTRPSPGLLELTL